MSYQHVGGMFPPNSLIGLHLQCLALIRRLLHQRGMRPSEVTEMLAEDDGATWRRLSRELTGESSPMNVCSKDCLRRYRDGLRTMVKKNEADGHDSTDWWPQDWRQAL